MLIDLDLGGPKSRLSNTVFQFSVEASTAADAGTSKLIDLSISVIEPKY